LPLRKTSAGSVLSQIQDTFKSLGINWLLAKMTHHATLENHLAKIHRNNSPSLIRQQICFLVIEIGYGYHQKQA
jgi:hypothetical protein